MHIGAMIKIFFSNLFIASFLLSLSYGSNLLDDYKNRIGSENASSKHDRKDAVVNLYLLTDEIKAIKKLHKKTFESTNEFNTRVKKIISNRYDEIDFYIKKGSIKYSAGTVEMSHYNPDSQMMTLKFSLDKEIKNILKQSNNIRSIVFFMPREEAKKTFGNTKKHYFHVKFQSINNQLTLSNIFFTKYLLFTNTNTNNVQVKEKKTCVEYTVLGRRLNIRKEPIMQSRIMGKLYKNDTVCIYETVAGWAKIEQGWVYKKYIHPNDKRTVDKISSEDRAIVSTAHSDKVVSIADKKVDRKVDRNDDSSSKWWIFAFIFFWFLFKK